jgi:hypothetical protein
MTLGPLSAAAVVLSLGAVLATRKASDRTAPLAAGAVAANVVLSLVVGGLLTSKLGRSTSLTLLDGALFYLLGFIAVCRFDRPLWLYALTAVTGLQTLSHAVYVAEVIPGHLHTVSLNILFAVQILCLIWGRFSAAEEDLKGPFVEDGPLAAKPA